MLVFSSSVVIAVLAGLLVTALFNVGRIARAAWRMVTAPFRWAYGLWVQHQLTRAAIQEARARAENELLWSPRKREVQRSSQGENP